MGNLDTGRLFQGLASEWEAAIRERRPRDVILSGALAYHLFHTMRDAESATGTLVCLQKAIDDAMAAGARPAAAPPACSFCGGSEPAVSLVAGARGFICDSCATLACSVFEQRSKGGY